MQKNRSSKDYGFNPLCNFLYYNPIKKIIILYIFQKTPINNFLSSVLILYIFMTFFKKFFSKFIYQIYQIVERKDIAKINHAMSFRKNFILIWSNNKPNRFWNCQDVDLYIQNIELYTLFIQTHNSEKGVFISLTFYLYNHNRRPIFIHHFRLVL